MNKVDHGVTRILAMIPARIGSTRLAMKNLALVNGKPLIYYAVRVAKEAGIFDGIVINAAEEVFGDIADRYNVNFYKRPSGLAASSAKSDGVVYDFIKNNPCDIVAWINPTSPLQSGEEVRNAVIYFLREKLDSLITVKDEQVHCLYKGKGINFRTKGLFSQTQDLTPVQPFVYSVMMWRTGIFSRMFEKNGYAFFCGKSGFYPVSKLSGMIIKRREDLMLADYILRGLSAHPEYRVRYDKLVNKARRKR